MGGNGICRARSTLCHLQPPSFVRGDFNCLHSFLSEEFSGALWISNSWRGRGRAAWSTQRDMSGCQGHVVARQICCGRDHSSAPKASFEYHVERHQGRSTRPQERCYHKQIAQGSRTVGEGKPRYCWMFRLVASTTSWWPRRRSRSHGHMDICWNDDEEPYEAMQHNEEPYEAMQHNLNKVFCGDPLSKFRFILRRRLQHFQSLNTQRFPEGFCARFLHQRLVLYRHWSCHGSLVNWVLMAHWRRITLPDWTCLAIADSRCWPHGFSAFSFVGVMPITQQSSLLSNYAALPTF